MTDTYLELVNSGFTAQLAKRLGLPRPARLRRHRVGDPLVPGPVLVLADVADGGAAKADADAIGETLLDWDLDVRRQPGDERFGAVVVVLTGVAAPADLSAPALALGGVLRRLAPGGRVVTVSRAPSPSDSPAVAAARQGIDGLLRSVAKELRGGATANGLLLADEVDVAAPSVSAALQFFLSGRSAFVDGQLLTVGASGTPEPGDPRPLAGQVAVVTGAARGIGAEIAAVFAEQGAELVLVDVPTAGDALAAVANATRGTALQLDLATADAPARLVAHLRERHGRVDVVVHNAGITRDKLLANMTPDRWDPVLAVNVGAPLRVTEALLASGLFGPAPRVVCLASTSGIAGNRGQTAYAASKAGVIGMVRASVPALALAGGTINAVAPGFIETEMTARVPFATREIARRLNSLQQGGRPRDVAETIAFLSSPAAGGISGQVLRVCGQNLVGA